MKLRGTFLALSALVTLVGGARAQHRPHHRHHAHPAHAVHVDRRYVRMRGRWHRPATPADVRSWEATPPRPPLVLRPITQGEPVTLTPDRDDGGFGDDDLALARSAFRDRRAGIEHDVPALLLDRVYRAMRHFHAPWAWVVSGYRSNAGASRHASGRAMDVVLPGVTEPRLAAFLRCDGFCGVGVYPLSGFVHVDVRNRSYFWVDDSPPGAPNRTREVRTREAAHADVSARSHGLTPPITNEGEGSTNRSEQEDATSTSPGDDGSRGAE